MLSREKTAPAQQARVADAALRPQDRGDFEGQKQPECIPDLSVRRS
jgi:hypothetical protein